MATNANMKSFYKQRKNTQSGGIAKSKARPSKKSPPTNHASGTVGSDITQPSVLLFHGSPDLKADEYDQKEEVLRQFDMNMSFGPCLGMTRMARWDRANRLSLNPPQEIGVLLKTGKVRSDCLWDGRI